MSRIAVISAILDEPESVQEQFNEVVAQFSSIIKGRMGLPFEKQGIATVCIVVTGTMDKINAFTGKLGRLPHVSVKTAISNKEVDL